MGSEHRRWDRNGLTKQQQDPTPTIPSPCVLHLPLILETLLRMVSSTRNHCSDSRQCCKTRHTPTLPSARNVSTSTHNYQFWWVRKKSHERRCWRRTGVHGILSLSTSVRPSGRRCPTVQHEGERAMILREGRHKETWTEFIADFLSPCCLSLLPEASRWWIQDHVPWMAWLLSRESKYVATFCRFPVQ